MQETINSAFEILNGNSWVALVGYLMGIVGFYLRIQSAIKSTKNKKIPTYKIKSQNVISERVFIDDLSVQFRGEPVNTLTVSKVAIWNSGKKTIDSTDIPHSDPIKISSKNGKIYHVEVLKVIEPSNEITVTPLVENKEYLVSFGYLDFRQGVLLKIIHSGTTSEDIEVGGIIKGFGRIVNKNNYVLEGFAVSLLKVQTSDGFVVTSKRRVLWIYLLMMVMTLGLPAMFRFRAPFTNWFGGITACFILI